MKWLASIACLMLAAALLNACSSTGEYQEDATAADGGPGAAGRTSGMEPGVGEGELEGGAGTRGFGRGGEFGADALNQPGSLLAERVIYFAYDSAEVEPQYLPVIAAHAEYIAAQPGVEVRLEGHADERGSPEYNVALGEQRAYAIKKRLEIQGAADGQVDIVSYGEEKPVAYGHDEESWRLNRRVEIVYIGS